MSQSHLNNSGINPAKAILLLVLPFGLAACGGGGGSSGPTTSPMPPPAQFTSFAAVLPSTPTTITGATSEGSYTKETTGAVLGSKLSNPTQGSGSATFTLNDTRQVTALTLTGAQSNVVFTPSNSTSQSLFLNGQPVATLAISNDNNNQAIFADPYALGFNYQTFGVWGTGLAGSGGNYGVASVGAPTSSTAIPTTGSVVFQGFAGGIYVNGSVWRYAANASFGVNFANRTVGLSTSNATLTNINGGSTASSGINISGTMTYASGASIFSGPLTAFQLSGTGSGTFYGPNANELGGTFFLRGPGEQALLGGFGGKR